MLPFCGLSAPKVWVSTSGDWWLAKNSRMQREDEHAEDLGRDADVVEDREEPDAEGVDERRDDERVMAMNVNMSLTPSGDGLARKSWSAPDDPVDRRRRRCTATAVTVTTCAQK